MVQREIPVVAKGMYVTTKSKVCSQIGGVRSGAGVIQFNGQPASGIIAV